MFIYFVRHGQTTGNQEKRFQTAETPLSAEGEVQAGKVAERLQEIEINEIWTSPMRRAQHTAEIINQFHNAPVVEKPELKEVKRASILEGKLANDPSIAHIRQHIWEHQEDPHFKFADMESFVELCDRAKKVVTMLEEHSKDKPEDYTLCVTAHGIVLSTIMLCILLQEDATPAVLRRAITRTRMENTGVSIAAFGEFGWRFTTLNDFAHL